MSCLTLCAVLLVGSSAGVGGPDVVVTAAPPVNAERLADAVRAYLIDYGIRVEAASAPAAAGEDAPGAGADLRGELAHARRTGEDLHAVIVVRADPGAAGRIEITLVDLATDKALVSSIVRPPRDEDLYRALALKIQALLRSTLSEAPERLAPGSAVARLVSPSPSMGGAADAGAGAGNDDPSRVGLALETGYAMLALATRGAVQGMSLAVGARPRPWFDVTLGIAGLGSLRTQATDVVAVASILPITSAVRVRSGGPQFEILAGPALELAVASVATTATSTLVRSSRDIILAAGGEVEGRGRLGSRAWAYARVTGLAVLSGPRYQVAGATVLDATGWQLAGGVGIGVDVR